MLTRIIIIGKEIKSVQNLLDFIDKVIRAVDNFDELVGSRNKHKEEIRNSLFQNASLAILSPTTSRKFYYLVLYLIYLMDNDNKFNRSDNEKIIYYINNILVAKHFEHQKVEDISVSEFMKVLIFFLFPSLLN